MRFHFSVFSLYKKLENKNHGNRIHNSWYDNFNHNSCATY